MTVSDWAGRFGRGGVVPVSDAHVAVASNGAPKTTIGQRPPPPTPPTHPPLTTRHHQPTTTTPDQKFEQVTMAPYI